VNPSTYHHTSNSALTNSFMRGDIPAYTATSPYAIPSDDRYGHQLGRQPSLDNGVPTIDTTYSSNPASAYGSPRDDDTHRFGMGLSPAAKGLSVLDAPLPASFDSNGISHAARYGPWPASVPSKFGLESPSHSLNAAKDSRTSETLKLLHTSAFGSSDHLSELGANGSDSNGMSMGRSPPVGIGSMLSRTGAGDEYFGKRAMHSSSLRYAKSRMFSSSAPKFDHDWDPEFTFEEDLDLVPDSLANEVLTPYERARRGSNTNTLRGLDDVETYSMSIGASPIAAPVGLAKFGSPSAGSPSRFNSWFQRQKEDEPLESGNGGFSAAGGSTSRSMKHAVSAFGHVGSPLRNSSLANGLGADFMNGHSSGSSPARPGSGSRSGSGAGDSLSALTQQLRRTGLADDMDPHLHPNTARNGAGSKVGGPGTSVIGRERERDRGLERHISSGSIGSSVTGRLSTTIDEEDLFQMEEEDETNGQARSRKRISGGHGNAANGWSYASAVAGKNAAAGNGGISIRDSGAPVESR
jgi:hypothetical protein